LKRVLIISPHFPPVNAADMHRVRQCLPYLERFGWEAEVVAVDPAFIESYSTDDLLLRTIPSGIKVHFVKAWDVSKTRKFGLGSLSMRSFFQYRKKGNELLAQGNFDLIFFSTTAFHVMALGPYWKKKFNIPFVLDIQDPWRNDFYLSKPKSERPPKFFVAYSIDKYLESKTVPFADAIISVSHGYCKSFKQWYHHFDISKCSVIPFGAVSADFDILESEVPDAGIIEFKKDKINIVYIGRGGHDMQFSLRLLFKTISQGLQNNREFFENIHCWFIGTSYAAEGRGGKTVEPIALEEGLGNYVTEITDRIPYFTTLFLLKKADLLFVPGSSDTSYTASKIFPYILAQKPLLSCFHKKSSVIGILSQAKTGEVVTFGDELQITPTLLHEMSEKLQYLILHKEDQFSFDKDGLKPYTAEIMTEKIVAVFNNALSAIEKK